MPAGTLPRPTLWLPRQKPVGAAQLNPSHPLARALRASFLLNELGAAQVHDSANNNIGTLTGGPVWHTDARWGPYLTFNGTTGQYVTIPDAQSLRVGAYANGLTLEVVVRFSSAQNAMVLNKRLASGTFEQYSVEIAGGTPSSPSSGSHIQVLTLSLTGSNNWGGRYPSVNYNDGTWHQAVMVLDGTSVGAGAMYVDGLLVSTTADTLGTIPNTDSAAAMLLGATATGASTYTGDLALARMWARRLNSAEVASLYANPYQMYLPQQRFWSILFAPASGGATTPVTVTASQSQSAALQKQANLLRAASQAQAVALAKTAQLSRSTTQPQTVAHAKQVNLSRAVTQAQAATITSLKVLIRVVSVTQAQAVALAKTIQASRSVTQAQTVSRAIQANLARGAVQPQTTALSKQANLARSVTQAQSLSIGSLKVLIRIVTAVQAQSVSLAKAIQLARSVAQPQSLTLTRSIALTRTLQQTQAVARTLSVRLARSMEQSQAASVAAQFIPNAGSVVPAATLYVVGRTRSFVASVRTRILRAIAR